MYFMHSIPNMVKKILPAHMARDRARCRTSSRFLFTVRGKYARLRGLMSCNRVQKDTIMVEACRIARFSGRESGAAHARPWNSRGPVSHVGSGTFPVPRSCLFSGQSPYPGYLHAERSPARESCRNIPKSYQNKSSETISALSGPDIIPV